MLCKNQFGPKILGNLNLKNMAFPKFAMVIYAFLNEEIVKWLLRSVSEMEQKLEMKNKKKLLSPI